MTLLSILALGCGGGDNTATKKEQKAAPAPQGKKTAENTNFLIYIWK